ncbi:sodium/potassium/calcium exchanger 2-like [Ostrea edulis]|uniref:sodium/potassium/calcium exchanger 2-like n=1 Tax=Ostrea edulis TaxID=37623 RepID=UPI0020961F11|nr:sodium/potassium/calcium exchanger 2-like [Ostrea edulis]XP_048732814.1 sodium/potassium/calcium exchanger 2-like [Ostrea edulis]XP_048732815.1 sodium/potassium/calcium exchanger 2-like [Ostrea edulis]XP_055995278.1 sodium/potassium/calcium exchanger 2-like [Ostrea edulis]XP_055995280.1 sodium/potassium/calcium exchanger 2-like [Ostrea edulis]XP_055995281.1 sodium/potassium/calcium exchanger 2-like [Ostrea edulis]XP_055995282.1 sodium/potassium/calcium exchanger 2-like [Ostrea edulis]
MNLDIVMRRRTRKLRLCILVSGLLTCYVGSFLVLNRNSLFDTAQTNGLQVEGIELLVPGQRQLLSTNSSSSDEALYFEDAFTEEQLKHGAVILHVIGMIYMFIALAIVCDEFFVPSLGVIIQNFGISEDVAGATFMAAGGSAPEFFTSLIGVFLAKSNVGVGTIVGSAVFNILFVIGMCALVSKDVLALTWWPLFRDVTFYSIDLLLLIIFFVTDQKIYWYEALVLFFLYICYVVFMKFNHKIERWVKSKLPKKKTRVGSSSQIIEKPERVLSVPILHSGGNHFRPGILELIIHHIDPMHKDSKPHNKAMHLHAIATLKVIIGTTHTDDPNAVHVDKDNNTIQANGKEALTPVTNGNAIDQDERNGDGVLLAVDGVANQNTDVASGSGDKDTKKEETLEEEEEPLDLSWPSGWRSRIMYVFVAPIVFPLWITLPDVRKQEKKKWFWCSFFGSILWIAIFSYLMNWWTNTLGNTIGLTDEIMGLTILAAGTSIPDLITSVIVAKKGFGDMAVSSSVGSNIFDITVGLPIPWLLYWAAFQEPINVDSSGMVCSIVLLFLMLIAVIVAIAISKWRMNKALGFSMLILYVIFLILSVLLSLKIIVCPVEV